MTETLLTKKQVAERLNISVWAVGQLLAKGHLPAVPVGARVRIRPADLDAYVNLTNLTKGRVPKTAEAIQDAIVIKGAASPSDFRDALYSEPEELQKRRRHAAKKAKRKAKKLRKKTKKLRQQRKKLLRHHPEYAFDNAGLRQPCPPGWTGPDCSVPVRKGVFAVELTKAGKPTMSASDPLDMTAELERQQHSADPAVREAATKALAPRVTKRREDDPAYWRSKAEHPASTAAERIQYLAKADQLETTTTRPHFTNPYSR